MKEHSPLAYCCHRRWKSHEDRDNDFFFSMIVSVQQMDTFHHYKQRKPVLSVSVQGNRAEV
jgi:hypothetical protein